MTGGCEWRHDWKRGLRFEKSQLSSCLQTKLSWVSASERKSWISASEEGLVSLFDGISTLFRLFNAKPILLEEQ